MINVQYNFDILDSVLSRKCPLKLFEVYKQNLSFFAVHVIYSVEIFTDSS